MTGARDSQAPFDLEAWLAEGEASRPRIEQAEGEASRSRIEQAAAAGSPPSPTTTEQLRPIVQAGVPVLRRHAREVQASWFRSAALEQLIEVMVTAMRKAPGVGLAAPQLGVPLRVFVAEDPAERLAQMDERARAERERTPLPLTVLINPKVEAVDADDRVIFFEGCLSVRGYAALVPRWRAVRVSGVDVAGKAQRFEWRGWPARIAQHEMDHLDGTLYVDRMISRSLTAESEFSRWNSTPIDRVLEIIGSSAPAPPK